MEEQLVFLVTFSVEATGAVLCHVDYKWFVSSSLHMVSLMRLEYNERITFLSQVVLMNKSEN